VLLGKLEIPDAEAEKLTDRAIVARLIEVGHSRLTAERIVAIEREKEQPSRARRHAQSR